MRWGLLALALLLVDCRLRTEYRPDVTAECEKEAGYDAGPEAHRRACEDCCHSRGLDNVEPGYCACGRAGIDVLMK